MSLPKSLFGVASAFTFMAFSIGCSSSGQPLRGNGGTGNGGKDSGGASAAGGTNPATNSGGSNDAGSSAPALDAAVTTDAGKPGTCTPSNYVCPTASGVVDTDCDVLDFGAAGDGLNDDTCAVQAALDYCGQVAKCHSTIATVHVPPGTYLLMPLILRSNVTFQLDGSASATDGGVDVADGGGSEGLVRLQFVPDPMAYPASGGLPITPAFINGNGVTNVAITGHGVIDGAGAQWWSLFTSTWSPASQDPRPYLVSFTNNSSNLTLSGVTLQNSPKFHLFFQNCSNIDVHGITIRAPSNSPNTDGIDPKSCTHVRISDCDISTGDDNVAITSNSRTGFAPPTSNDTEVYNCRFGAGHGVSIGSPTYGDVGGMNVHDCTFNGTQNGIRIKSNATSGGLVDGIIYNNLQMTKVTNVIVLDEYYSDKPSIPPLTGDAGAPPPVSPNEPEFRNIHISNINATDCGSAGIIRGRAESPIYNVFLDNVNIASSKGMTIRFAQNIQFTNSTIVTPAGVAPLTLQVDPSEVTGIGSMLDAGP